MEQELEQPYTDKVYTKTYLKNSRRIVGAVLIALIGVVIITPVAWYLHTVADKKVEQAREDKYLADLRAGLLVESTDLNDDERVVEQHLIYLLKGDDTGAYKLTSTQYQKDHTLKQFTEFVQKYRATNDYEPDMNNYDIRDIYQSEKKSENAIAVIRVELWKYSRPIFPLYHSSGREIDYELINENGLWRITEINPLGTIMLQT